MNKVKLKDVIQFNPSETIKKGNIAKKISMEKILPHTKKITSFENAIYSSGPKFKNDDTLLAKITPCLENGKTAFVDILDENEVAFGSSEFIILRAIENISDVNYIYYLARSPKFRNRAIGCMEGTSGRKRVNDKTLKSEIFDIPDIKTQSAIARVLSSLDDKIELNNKIKIELESMAKMIYEYWFVQFDFPNKKGKPYKSSGGKMVWNEQHKHHIPKGWSICQLKNFLKNVNELIEPGIRLQGQFYTPIDELPKKQMSFYGGLDGKEANSSLQTYKINDILLGAMRVYFHRVCIAAQNGITRSTTMVLRPYNKDYLHFIYELLNQDTTIQYATNISIGSQQPYVNWEGALSDYTVILPEERYIVEYSKIISPFIEEVFCRVKENYELAQLRDFLLPLLMNGQVTVKNIENNTNEIIPFNNLD